MRLFNKIYKIKNCGHSDTLTTAAKLRKKRNEHVILYMVSTIY